MVRNIKLKGKTIEVCDIRSGGVSKSKKEVDHSRLMNILRTFLSHKQEFESSFLKLRIKLEDFIKYRKGLK